MANRRPFSDHFSTAAPQYARCRPDYPEALFAYLARLAPASNRAWDCATGNGQAALALARHFDRVVATDASERQISCARPHRRVRYWVASAEESGLEKESVELVTVAQALHWLDRPRFWKEVRRVLVPRGVIAVWCYDLLRVDRVVDAVVGRLYKDVVGPYWPPERSLVERGYRGMRFPFAEQAPPSFRMEKRWTLENLTGYLATWSAARRYTEDTGENPVDRVREDLGRAWGPAGRTRRVTWDLDLRVGRKAGSP